MLLTSVENLISVTIILGEISMLKYDLNLYFAQLEIQYNCTYHTVYHKIEKNLFFYLM